MNKQTVDLIADHWNLLGIGDVSTGRLAWLTNCEEKIQ
jgi:hypothetical protein